MSCGSYYNVLPNFHWGPIFLIQTKTKKSVITHGNIEDDTGFPLCKIQIYFGPEATAMHFCCCATLLTVFPCIKHKGKL